MFCTISLEEILMARILLIDDSQLARYLLRSILTDRGYTICGEATTGTEGVEKFKQTHPDLVFCDIMMNEMDGVACLRSMMAENPNAKVVICTAIGDEPHINETSAAGALDYIQKPIKAADVIAVTEKLIGKPTPSYKKRMEQKAASCGIDLKQVLDFFDAFRQIAGMDLDSPDVNEQFFKDKMSSTMVGVHALLVAKMPSAQADRLVSIFEQIAK